MPALEKAVMTLEARTVPKLICLVFPLLLATNIFCSDFRGMAIASSPSRLEVPARKYINKRVVIPGGHYASAFVITSSATEYSLDGDVFAEGTAIAIRAPKVVLNLNGKTINYNLTKPGEGVTIDAYHANDVAIIDGSIIQGEAQSEGDVYGGGNNPIKSLGVARIQVANVNTRYGGRDVNGISLRNAEYSVVENCTVEDLWNIGTMKNRHQGKTAIAGGTHAIIRYNKIINARQGGIGSGDNSEIYGNNISINSMVTNSAGIGGYKVKNVKVFNNTVVARGEHPIGIAYVSAGTDNIDIYNNTIDVQTTKLGDEYEAAGGNYAVGFRTTWGGNNINFHDNTITIRTDSNYKGTRTVDGRPVVVNGKGRGLMVAVNEGESAKFSNNKITVLDSDGIGKAFGIACTGGNAGEMIFEGNTVTSNILNVALSDEYGACGGYPLFIHNTFVKSDNYPAYSTVASELEGYFEGTGRFVSNVYKDGATKDSININAGGQGHKSVFFGRELSVQLATPTGPPIAEASVTILNGGVLFDSTAITDEHGKAKLIVYNYELHNTNSKTALKREIAPHIIEAVVGADTYTTHPDASTSGWDTSDAHDNYNLPLYKNNGQTVVAKINATYR
jgi:hypothetical protein